MRAMLEKLVVTSLLVVFAAAFGSTLVMKGFSLTEEEAVEISRNSGLVQKYAANASSFILETHYYNLSEIERLKQLHSDPIFQNAPEDYFWERSLPEGHTAWEVIWWFHYGIGGYDVGVFVDADTGIIIYEALGASD